MRNGIPILRSLDPYHQRLGYLNCVALVAGRDLDRRDALGARFQDMIFERLSRNDPRWRYWHSRASGSGQEQIERAMAIAARNDPSSILLPTRQEDGWVYFHDLWLNDSDMPSSVGSLSYDAAISEEAKLYRPIELAKWIGLILPTYELAEDGVILKHLLNIRRAQLGDRFNPLLISSVRPLQLMYIRMLLRAECLFPALIAELIRSEQEGQLNTSGSQGLLLTTATRILNRIGEPQDPADILELQGLLEFREALTRSDSTAENYLRPRIEILVDLDLIKRQPRQEGFVWTVNNNTKRCSEEWSGLADDEECLDDYLDSRFFGSMATVYGQPGMPIDGHVAILREFGRAYSQIGREFGFTPGRTVALIACINAWIAGRFIEIADVFKAISDVANTPLGKHLYMSGGSRFDKEFLVRIAPEFLASLPE